MIKNPVANTPLALGAKGVVIFIILLAGVRLSELIPVTRSPGGSLQNWRAELIVSIFLVICSIWIIKHRAAVIERLSMGDTHIAVMMWCLAGFALWSAASALWATSTAAVLLHTVTWLAYIAVLVFSLVLFRSKGGLQAVVWAAIAASSVTALLCLADYFSIKDPGRDVGIIRIRYARFAECFLTLSPLMCVWALYVRGRLAVVATITGWLLGWLVVMLSASKGAFIAGIIGHVVLFVGCVLLTKYPIRRKTAGLAGVWLVFTMATQVALAALSPIPTVSDYISGEADATRETSLMRVFTWQVGLQMFANNPIIGVGANNFGIEFNKARVDYFKDRPEDTSPDPAEWYLVERAHNEFLQILSELGVIGTLLFAGAFLAFGVLVIRRFISNGYRLPPLLWASLAGMTAFFASSFVSSFSFRIAQNGVFFFIVFALGINEVIKMGKTSAAPRFGWVRPILAASLLGAFGMAFLMGSRAYADYLIVKAAGINDVGRAMPYYTTAMQLDPDNSNIYQRVAEILAARGQHGPASVRMRSMIDSGGGTTFNYSVLTDLLVESGQMDRADATLKEAIAIYPTSVFMRARYAAFLEERGRQAEAEEQMPRAIEINASQANGWYALLASNGKARAARQSQQPIAASDELYPVNARDHYVTKKERERDRRSLGTGVR